MDLILPFSIPKANNKLSYSHKILCMGSCFAEEIGSQLLEYKFDTMLNPHGILFNTQSIVKALNDYLENKQYQVNDLVQLNDTWHSLHHHGSFSNANSTIVLEKINTQISSAHNYLKQANHLFITLGSSWVYRHIQSNQLVANCHKIPQQQFQKELLTSQYQQQILEETIARLIEFNPKIKISFTVSPVKYIRDGLIENNLSKAQLLTTVYSICNQFDFCSYFPSYELITDVLRDYRFYKEDMVHPNKQAIKYVWEKFIEATLEPNEINLFESVNSYIKLKNHTPLSESSSVSLQEKLDTILANITSQINACKKQS